MKPTIYKPSIYNGAGIYKGAGGLYKGRGVYNDGEGGGSPIPPEYTAYDWIRFDGASSTSTWMPIIIISLDTNKDVEFVFTYKLETSTKVVIQARVPAFNTGQVLYLEIGSYYGEQTDWGGFQNGGNYDWPSPRADIKYHDQKSTLSIINDKIKDFETEQVLATCPGGYSPISFLNKGLALLTVNDQKPMKSYGGKIIKNGVTLYEWVPVKENDTGKCGFYDIVNNVFTTFTDPAAFSHWTAGNDT